MEYDTKLAAEYAGQKLDSLLERAARDTADALGTNDIPTAITHFARFRETVDTLADKMGELQKLVQKLSYEFLPTMMGNQGVPSIKIDEVGTVSVVNKWSASILDGQKERAFEWLRSTGNGGMIIETVPAPKLGAFARTEAEDGKPLPTDIFDAKQAPYISIRKA